MNRSETTLVDAGPIYDAKLTAELGRLQGGSDQASPEDVSLPQLSDIVRAELEELEKQQQNWRGHRSKGPKRVTTALQKFIEKFDRLMLAFGPVVEAAKLADNQYGGAIAVALTMFFVAAKLKLHNDQSIMDAMSMIVDRLPEVDVLKQVYPDSENLQKYSVEACKEIILFAREACSYFSAGGVHRAVKGILKPAVFKERAETIAKQFNRIARECEMLLAKTIKSLREEIADLSKVCRDTRAHLEIRESARIVDELYLPPSPNRRRQHRRLAQDLAARQDMLRSDFEQYRKEFHDWTLDDFEKSAEYGQWTAAQASLLVLHGKNNDGVPQTVTSSWLSLAALAFAFRLQGTQWHVEGRPETPTSPVVAWLSCGVDDTPDEVLKNLISQLLQVSPSAGMGRRSPHLLMSESTGGDSTYSTPRKPQLGDVSEDCVDTLFDFVQSCPRPVYLVIDRPEYCQLHRKGQKGLIYRFLKALLENVARANADANCNLHVLAVVRTDIWDVEEKLGPRSDFAAEFGIPGELILMRRDQGLNEC